MYLASSLSVINLIHSPASDGNSLTAGRWQLLKLCQITSIAFTPPTQGRDPSFQPNLFILKENVRVVFHDLDPQMDGFFKTKLDVKMLDPSLSSCCYEDYVLPGCIALFTARFILTIGAIYSSGTSGSSQTTRRYNEEEWTNILPLNASSYSSLQISYHE
jgi:hypothetical protein